MPKTKLKKEGLYLVVYSVAGQGYTTRLPFGVESNTFYGTLVDCLVATKEYGVPVDLDGLSKRDYDRAIILCEQHNIVMAVAGAEGTVMQNKTFDSSSA